MTDEALSPTICLVEKALNNRPLTLVSGNPKLEALTPYDFLLGRLFQALPRLALGDGHDLH